MVCLDYHFIVAAWDRTLSKELLENSLNFAHSARREFINTNDCWINHYLAGNTLAVANENMAQCFGTDFRRAVYSIVLWRYFCTLLS